MNLADGRLLDEEECARVTEALEERLLATLSKPRLDPSLVLDACDRLVRGLDAGAFSEMLPALGIPPALAEGYFRDMSRMFSRQALETRLEAEFGGHGMIPYTPPGGRATEQILPLGVVLHIAAGNADGLPAFSVLEGLLCGNINLLKLPAEERVSIHLLRKLVEAEPALAEYVYVFDYTSKDAEAIEKLVRLADAVAVWGGDETVRAFRRLAGPDTRLIEWGHRISFAYVTEAGMRAEALLGLANGICRTDQLLCSSCQGIFVDTGEREAVYRFCERFLPLLEQAAERRPANRGQALQAQITLEVYSASLEAADMGRRVFQGRGCSVTACPDAVLEPSMQFRNCWARALPRRELLRKLRPYKGRLQTAALLCGAEEFSPLADLLLKAGVIRITRGDNMSAAYCGAPHDGEFPLRRYTKVAALEL